jgi:hypothetical protein
MVVRTARTLRVDYVMPVSKAPYDVMQRLRFNAGPF